MAQWKLRFSESRRVKILSPDWLPRLDVNWGWSRHVTGEDVNPHVKGSLRAQNQAAGAYLKTPFPYSLESGGCPVPSGRRARGRSYWEGWADLGVSR